MDEIPPPASHLSHTAKDKVKVPTSRQPYHGLSRSYYQPVRTKVHLLLHPVPCTQAHRKKHPPRSVFLHAHMQLLLRRPLRHDSANKALSRMERSKSEDIRKITDRMYTLQHAEGKWVAVEKKMKHRYRNHGERMLHWETELRSEETRITHLTTELQEHQNTARERCKELQLQTELAIRSWMEVAMTIFNDNLEDIAPLSIKSAPRNLHHSNPKPRGIPRRVQCECSRHPS